MDHTEKQERLAELQELISRVDPYLELVAEMFKTKASSFTYTNEELVEFSHAELQQLLADVQRLSARTWELWESLCRAERPIRIHEHCKAEGRNFFRTTKGSEVEPVVGTPDNMSEAEVQALMKALVQKISGG